MKTTRSIMKSLVIGLIASSCITGLARSDANMTNKNKGKGGGPGLNWKNLESDIAGVARHTDSNLVNPWGIAVSPAGTIWVNDNGEGVATVYNPDGTATSLVVTIPASASNSSGASPTGIVLNGTSDFNVTNNATSLPAVFIFVSEDGVISGWNPQLDSTNALVAKDNGASGAIYKGVTLASSGGNNFLYVTNFHSGKVEMYDKAFNRVDTASTFVDPNLPAGYAPFGIRNLNGAIYVTYALQDANAEDDVPGPGNGFIDVYNADGTFVSRLVSGGKLNSPWGLAIPTIPLGKFKNALLVGNFGDGQINAYDPTTGVSLGTLRGPTPDKTALQFDGLWDLAFLNGALYFSAGIADEEHGLFGVIFQPKGH